MSTRSGPTPTFMSTLRSTVERENHTVSTDLEGPASDAALRKYCDNYFDKILPIMTEKVQKREDRAKAAEIRKNYHETQHHHRVETPSGDLRKQLEAAKWRNTQGGGSQRRTRSRLPKRKKDVRETVFKRLRESVFHRLGDKEENVSVCPKDRRQPVRHSTGRKERSNRQDSQSRPEGSKLGSHETEKNRSRKTNNHSDDEPHGIGYRRSEAKKRKQNDYYYDLDIPWICKGIDPFTPRIRYIEMPLKIRMPTNVKVYDGSEDPEDHLKIFQAAAKVERWAMPTWCHVFNSTLTGSSRVWFDDLPPESIDSYNKLKEVFLTNFLQQKKCIKDPVEIHHIKQKDGELTEDLVQRFKEETRNVKGDPEIMKISGFMHVITDPELIKRLHDRVPKSMAEVMNITTSFLRGEAAAGRCDRKRPRIQRPMEQATVKHRQYFRKELKNKSKAMLWQLGFHRLIRPPEEIPATRRARSPGPSSTTVIKEKVNGKFCEFQEKARHTTEECLHLKKPLRSKRERTDGRS